MKKFIESKLVEMLKECTTDKYGQVQRFNFRPSIFGDKSDEVEEYCKNNKGILQYSTYGGAISTYRAFEVLDANIKKACAEALRTNKNRLRNLNSW